MKQTTQFIISVHEPKTINLLSIWNIIYSINSNIKHLNSVQSDFSICTKANAKIKNKTVSNPEENSLFLDLKPYAFLLKAVAPALSVPLVTNLRWNEGIDKGAVPTRRALSLHPSSEFLWMMGVLVNPSSNSLPIIHFRTDRAFLGIMTGICLFSDSIHSIRFAFAPLELFFFLILLFLHLYCSFFLCLPILL